MESAATTEKKTIKPNQHLKIHLKKGQYGCANTEKPKDLVDLIAEYFTEFQESFNSFNEDDQEDILVYFEQYDENYSDIFFGDNSEKEDIQRYMYSRTDAKQEEWLKVMQEALDQVLHKDTPPRK